MTAQSDPLPTVQRWMQQALIAPGRTDPEAIGELIDQPASGNAVQRLAIYQRSYYDRLLTCMREQFPALCHALGRELFDDFALDYLQANPPESYTLYDLGRRFAGHLKASRPDRDAADGDKENWIDFMIELALFERQIFVMFDAPGHEGKVFADAGTPNERLALQPCFAICAYAFPVARYYHDVKAEAEPDFPPAQASHYALVRTDYVTRTLAVTAPQYRLLELLLAGGSVDDALARSSADYGLNLDDVQEHWGMHGGLKTSWLSLGFFIDKEL
ncbi:DNA-binding domain-containing protein [uncultured Erythrobacter sp.]|uniref:HvfC/BufC N-terminal domain-containing protein n=1 Tax=uncultured Erythrobacter sp. TaxID=263913 RepID=UPI002612034F|nr:DNA-binding domain-containing protein [uncultured Erythrobacter sp.]